MGDGRYYTYIQFTEITLYLLVMVFLTIVFMMFFYKSSSNHNYKRLILPFILLILSLVFRFSESCIVSKNMAYNLRVLWLISLLSAHCLILLNNIKMIHSIVLVIIISTIGILAPSVLISHYAFYHVTYTSYVYVTLIIMVVLNMLLLIHHHLKHHDKEFTIIHLLYWMMPFLLLILSKEKTDVYALSILYVCHGIYLYKVAIMKTPFRIGSSVFSKIRKNLLDYIYIINENGEVIYANQKVKEASFLNTVDNIDPNDLESIFKKPIEISHSYKRLIIKYKDDNNMYFNFSTTPLKENNKIIGYILTLIDITDLIELLDRLKNKQEESLKLNQQLSEYKNIVYDLEKEKEINKILAEISLKQEKAMKNLKMRILHLGDDDLSSIIMTAKSELKDVRKAVTTYMNYYNEEVL